MAKKRGLECLNPDCDVIRVSTKRGHGWEETKVMRRAIVTSAPSLTSLTKSY